MRKRNDDDKMIKLIKDGLSYKDVSKILNKTSDSIRCRCFRLGVKSSDYKKCKSDTECLECGIVINKLWSDRKFCSKSCSTIFNNKNRKLKEKTKNKKHCKCCNSILNKNSKTYCSQKCHIEYKYKNVIQKWKDGVIDGNVGENKEALSQTIRKYIFEKYDSKCTKCGWNEINKFTGKIPLEIDHIDGNHLNSIENNLVLLCPSCHSLTEFYGSRNKGRGRKNRRKIN
jgi:predicted nucleic acid-binding Zn ribbon protein